MMPAVGLNPFNHPVDFNELRLPDLVSFFTYISKELSRLHAMVGLSWTRRGCGLPSSLPGDSFQGSITGIHSCHWTPSLTSWLPSTGTGLCGRLHPASPTSCASRSRGTLVVFRHPLHGHVHVSVQHDRWIKLRQCRSVIVAQSVWVCLVAFSSQYSCSLFVHAHLSTPLHACS